MSGIEAIKSSTPKVCRDGIKKSLELIMGSTEEKMQEYIQEFKSEFKKLDFEQISSPSGVTKISDYIDRNKSPIKGTPWHVKGSILYNNLIDRFKLSEFYETIGNGDKIKHCVLKVPNPYGFEVISCPGPLPKEFKLDPYIDYDAQFEKAFIKPLSIILKSIGWNIEKTSTLEDFFG